MIFRPTPLDGAFLIEPERHVDERGFFARTFGKDAFAEAGLASEIVEESIAWNEHAGTVRGLHFQFPPFAEVKLVRCTRGAVHDVIVDLRPESTTFGTWFAARLDAVARVALYVPERFAHGYQVLVDDSEVSYAMTARYAPDAAAGIRFDDPGLAIDWPLPIGTVSRRDRALPRLDEARDHLLRAMAV
jgi:dTDP-4-dehydrorhamnose 3,5-epimerase